MSNLKIFRIALSLLFVFMTTAISAQTINGKVVDANGEPVIGATIKVAGTNTGAISDVNGNFSVNAAAGAKLNLSYTGFKSQTVNARNGMTIKMEEDAVGLNDLVVIGYGVQRKSDLTGAIAKVKEEDLQNRSTTDAAAALQGKVAGVQILNTSGAPGEAAQIRVRGYSSNSGNLGPLLIVDGLKVDNIQYLDPAMIESIEVLKDAASAAIYGAEAGNGVVLITTSTGKAGHSSISYDFKLTNQRLGKKAKLFGGDEYVEYQKYIGQLTDEQLRDNGYVPGTDYNWFDAVFEPSWSTQHAITFQGGNDKGHYLAAINYVHNNGIIKGDKDVYNRLSGQINADYQIKPWLKVGTTNNIEKWDRKSVSQQAYGSMLNSVMSLDPLTPAFYTDASQLTAGQLQHIDMVPMTEDGLYYAASKYLEEATGNPLWQRDRTDGENKGFSVRGTAYLNLTPIEGLTYTSRLGYRIHQSNSHSYSMPYWLTGMAQSTKYNISSNANTSWYYQWENFINYNKTFAEKHNLGVMVGMSYMQNYTDNNSISSEGENILSGYEPNFRYISYLLSDASKSVSNTYGVNMASISYFGRLNYNYDQRYYFQANLRSDAYDSSKLSKDKRWGTFPSFSAGWAVSNEKFWKDNVSDKGVSYLKIRASWGRNGNVNVLNGYQYANTIGYHSQWYQYSAADTQTYGSAPGDRIPNPDLKWETSEQIDLGLDARFLSNRLSFGMDWYRKTTKDLLVNIKPIPESGAKSAYFNAGNVLNTGFEFEIAWKDRIGDFSYGIGFNCATLKNEVKELSPVISRLEGTGGGVSGLNYKIRTSFEEGQPIWYFRGINYKGVDPKTGAPIYINSEGIETDVVTDGDLQYIGSAIPKFTYGINLNAAWKGIDFNMFATGVSGNKIFSLLYSADRPKTNTLCEYWENSWRQPGDNAKYPDMKQVYNNWYFWSSNASLFNGAFLKIKQIQLGYTLPREITRKAYIERLRFFVSLDDFFTITSYPGCDPETATTGQLQDMGYDAGSYPTTKKILFGVNLTF